MLCLYLPKDKKSECANCLMKEVQDENYTLITNPITEIIKMINDIYFQDFPQLESERLIFRKFIISDASDIQSIRTDKDVMKYMDSNPHTTLQDSKNFISKNIETYKKGNGLFWAIIEKSTNTFIGDFSYWRILRENHRAEIGYTLKPQFWGKGFMKETIIELIKFGFNNLNLHSIEANVNPENESSKKLLHRLGFRKEGYFKENYYFDGKYLDSEIFSLLEVDFKHS